MGTVIRLNRRGAAVQKKRGEARRGTAARAAPALSKEMIVRAARELVRRRGCSKVSMRLLGERLGVSAPAIYYHFKSRRALFDCVATSVFEEIAKIDTKAPWTEQLRCFVLAYQQRLIEYPGLARVILTNRESRAGLLWIETTLSILKRAGLDNDAIWSAFGMLVFFVNPMTLFDEGPRKRRQSLFDAGMVRRAVEEAPLAYPHFAEILTGVRGDMAYDALLPIVLDRLIAQLERDVIAAPCSSSHRSG